jgi:transcriptional regulator with XRE-family HTH domain
MNVDIKQERERRGWKQVRVAKEIGLTKSAYRNIETGQRNPSYPVYCKLMSLFGYEFPRLVFGEAGGEGSDLSGTG